MLIPKQRLIPINSKRYNPKKLKRPRSLEKILLQNSEIKLLSKNELILNVDLKS